MFTHEDIWAAIDRLASSAGYSPSGLAKKAGLDSTTFNKSKRSSRDGKPRWPSTESIAKILSVTGMNMSEFTGFINGTDMPTITNNNSEIPIADFKYAESDTAFNERGTPQEQNWKFIKILNEDSYAIKQENGKILIISPSAKISNGDKVIIKSTSGALITGELKEINSGIIKLSSGQNVPAKNTHWMHRVMWIN